MADDGQRRPNRAEIESQARYRLIEELARSEQHYRMLAEHTTDVISFRDISLDLTYVSPSIERLTGFTSEEYMGLGDSQRFFGHSLISMRAALAEQTGSDDHHLIMVEFKCKDGGSVNAEVSMSYIRDAQGTPTGIVEVARDISERIQAAAEKEKLEEQLHQAQKMESIGRLAGGVAHDFNNLISVIMGYTELLPLDGSLTDQQNEDLQQITDAVNRARDLTQQLLMFSRKQVVRLKPTRLNDHVAAALKLYRRLLGEDVTVDFRPRPDLPLIMADGQQLDQVLANLLINARDAIFDCGADSRLRVVMIETSFVEMGPLMAGQFNIAPGGYLCMAVSDTGKGMDKETQSKIFEPFFTTKGEGKGTGLGLATVFGVVGQNKGAIAVYSEPGHGTTFRIFWPALGSPESETSVRSKSEPVTGGTETILFVEDEAGVRDVGRRALVELGYRVITAASGEQAVNLLAAARVRPDILVTDVVLPKMNGKQLADKMGVVFPDIPVLFTSGYTNDIIAQHGILASDIALLEKPYSIASFAARIREMLDG